MNYLFDIVEFLMYIYVIYYLCSDSQQSNK